MKKILILLYITFAFSVSTYALTPDEASDKLAQRLISANDHSLFMYYVINQKDYETVKLFVEAKKVDINQYYCGSSPLSYALYYKQPEKAMLMLKNGADPKTQKKGAYSALYLAVKYGYTDIVREMLKDPNLNIKKERMFFRIPYVVTARNKGFTEIEQMLIEHQKQYDASHSALRKVVPEKNQPAVIIKPTVVPEEADAI